MITPQSRVQLYKNPPALPGTCIVCGSAGGDSRKFIDFGKQIDWYGAVYFCTECVGEVAEAADFVTTASVENTYDQLKKARLELTELKKKFEAIKHGFLYVLSDSNIDSNFNSLLDGFSSYLEKLETEHRGEEGTKVGHSKTSKSGSIEGSDDVSESTESEFGI